MDRHGQRSVCTRALSSHSGVRPFVRPSAYLSVKTSDKGAIAFVVRQFRKHKESEEHGEDVEKTFGSVLTFRASAKRLGWLSDSRAV